MRPAAHEAEESRELPKKLISKGWEIGLLQASTPEAYGGFGERSAVTGALAVEEMAFGDLAGAYAVVTPSLFATPILLAGSEEQKKQYLPEVVGGDWRPYTAALIEFAFDFDANAFAPARRSRAGNTSSTERRPTSRLRRMPKRSWSTPTWTGRRRASSSRKTQQDSPSARSGKSCWA